MRFVFYIIIVTALSGCRGTESDTQSSPTQPNPNQSNTITVSCICLPDIGRHTDLFSKPIDGVGTTTAEAIKDARSVCDKYAQYNTLSCN